MNDFQKETAAKMATYKENVGKIAEYLYTKFHKVEMDDYYDHEMEMIEKGRCEDKATRLYQFFSSVDEVKRMIDFLNTVKPGMARDLVDGL